MKKWNKFSEIKPAEGQYCRLLYLEDMVEQYSWWNNGCFNNFLDPDYWIGADEIVKVCKCELSESMIHLCNICGKYRVN